MITPNIEVSELSGAVKGGPKGLTKILTAAYLPNYRIRKFVIAI